LYGAGHVAQALIRVVAELPFEVTWIDSRAELLPTPLPDNVHPLCVRAPANTINSAPAGARFLVMTHDHGLDYALCRKILERNEFAWLGLIGSKSKGARFRSRLARDGIPAERIARLVSPIGIEGVNNKWPAAIAVAVAAQLLQGVESPAGVTPQGLDTACTSPDCATCMAAGRPANS
jgi:xanthine dehydrogenase accessory factor